MCVCVCVCVCVFVSVLLIRISEMWDRIYVMSAESSETLCGVQSLRKIRLKIRQ